MKKKYYTFMMLVAFSLAACKTSTTGIQVLRPADITLDENIIHVGIINRTYPTQNNKGWNIAEGILTGEGIGTDRRASEAETDGMISIMQRSPRFKVNRLNITQLEGSGTGMFPEPLQWTVIENICQQNKVDALICLEAFDSDSRLNFVPVTIRQNMGNNVYKDIPALEAQSRMNVTSGWRIYYPAKKQILDEHRFVDFMNFTGRGLTEREATSKLPARMDALVKTAIHAGEAYGYRISPMWENQNRTWYKKGSPKLLNAAAKVRVNDWNGAAELWKMESVNTDKKIAGYACYNMAVFCETRGNLDVAIEWAQKSYSEHGLKRGISYVRLLQSRKRDAEILDQQMSPVNKE